MTCTRRGFLKRSALLGSAAMILPGLRAAMAAPGASPRKLVLIDLRGGNDGLNMVVPYGVNGGAYFSEFRPTLNQSAGSVLQIGGGCGLNPTMTALKSHFDAGRLAVIPGVGYPDPSFSHEVATEIWATGSLSYDFSEGWLARALDQFAAPTFPSALDVDESVTTVLRGRDAFVPSFTSISQMKYPTDSSHPEDKVARRVAYQSIASGLTSGGGASGTMSTTIGGMLSLIDTLQSVPQYAYAGTYPDHYFAKQMKMVARLLNANLGLDVYHVMLGGWDTHSDQELDGYHSLRLGMLSDTIGAFYADLVNLGIDDDTLVVVYSEFGRTVYQNGSNGTDHGTVNPVFVLGGAVNGGLIVPHPALDPAALDENGELARSVDFRDVFGTIVDRWFSANVAQTFPGHAYAAMNFLP